MLLYREQHLRRIESEKASDFGFDWLALWIAGQRFGIQRAQPCQHTRRATDRTLVEIETQSLAARQGRTIGTQTLHCGAGLKHENTSPATIQRVRAHPRLRRGHSRETSWQEMIRT